MGLSCWYITIRFKTADRMFPFLLIWLMKFVFFCYFGWTYYLYWLLGVYMFLRVKLLAFAIINGAILFKLLCIKFNWASFIITFDLILILKCLIYCWRPVIGNKRARLGYICIHWYWLRLCLQGTFNSFVPEWRNRLTIRV